VGSDINVVNIRARRLVSSFILSPILLASVLYPFQAQASVFSFITNLFSSTQVKAETTLPNSQTMALLQATISPIQENVSTTTNKEIAIVGGTSLVSDALPAVEQKSIDEDQISLYVVHPGDTLPAIAKMFGVSVNTIKWGNDIKGNTVTVGQTLVILPISGIQHTVKSGDTLQSIAKLHKGDLEEILQYNNLSKDAKLVVGDIIIVPDGESVTTHPSVGVSVGVGKTSPSISVYEGYYMRPIIGGIKSQGIHGHNGVDLASSYGTNILAAADGEVIISKNSGYNGGYGSYIVIKHGNGTQTLYGHLSATLVGVGERVTQGQVIGKMGSTGKSTGVHVHFEIRGARNPF
jgi:LysM repeat protein